MLKKIYHLSVKKHNTDDSIHKLEQSRGSITLHRVETWMQSSHSLATFIFQMSSNV